MYAESHRFDVCVIGGGMAGMCAAIASARNGARTALVHDRPVFGGNASSEVRMWICGAHGRHNKETGILEEIQLENLRRNPGRNYSVWDSVLWEKIRFQPNLTPFLNAACVEATMDGDRITSIRAYQSSSQTWHTISAQQFIDCSGDSVLAGLTPARFRIGREANEEFDENIEPEIGDRKTMGNSLLIQLRRTNTPQTFTPPRWAVKFTQPEDLSHRISGVNAANFWWIEIGGLSDTIRDAEPIRDELMAIAYGVWDYLKNHAPERAQAANWAIEWIGSLPGKRESRRYVGDHTLTQNDIRAGGAFEDTVAYGGWSMDDHHPAGLLYPGAPTIFHPAPSPYGIPFRCLYSVNIPNLLFAGRNISVTHAALSSTRVMATCAILGQAAGTAAALCIRLACAPRALSVGASLQELQQTLTDGDCFLPNFRPMVSQLALSATLCADGVNADALRDGTDRDRAEEPSHAWETIAGGVATYRWSEPVAVAGVRLVFDSDLSNEKRMQHVYPTGTEGRLHALPDTLVRSFRVEACDAENGQWATVFQTKENSARLVRVPLKESRIIGVQLIVEEAWADRTDAPIRVFAFEPQTAAEFRDNLPTLPDGPHISELRARIAPSDLAPPANSGTDDRQKARSAA